jgi:hypothetical protein
MSIFLETLQKHSHNFRGEADKLYEAHESNVLARFALEGLTEIGIEMNNIHSAQFKLGDRLKKRDKYDSKEAIEADMNALSARANDLEVEAENIIQALNSSFGLDAEPFFRVIYIY